ncbi:protein disulfide isomerase-like 1-6 [Impatiens glandulifera]|uniref:protein disulfide isomerase-like 1-6 n=1 Tax=Impatiens glandulifera TaxID=253017 RepID=UPI001FB1706D|nr:protein disulfide isomerase-like 1-6 [Impatiens glandulifera]
MIMVNPKPSSRFIFFTLTLFLILTLFITSAITSVNAQLDNEDLEADFDELIALDEEVDSERKSEEKNGNNIKQSEAELLSKAQRIVIELNSDNTKRVIDENEFILVLGYAPWCPRSAELMPRFAEAATALKDLGSSLLMAKIDIDRHTKSASSLEIKGVPTLLLFVNGTSQPYSGGFTSEEIVVWSMKKTGVPIQRIGSVSDANQFLNKHSIFVVGFFDKFQGSEYEEFVKAAAAENEIQFIETSNLDVANILFPDVKIDNLFIGLVKNEAEKFTSFNGIVTVDGILQFVNYNKFPLVTILTELNSAKVYSSLIKLQLYVFANEDDFKSLVEPLREIARKFRSKIMFIYIDINEDNLAKPFLTMLGIEGSDETVVAAFNNEISSKYLLEADPTPSEIEEFCARLAKGTQPHYYKSQPIPSNEGETENIHVIVGKTFTELVLSSPNNIVLEVHTPWCMNGDVVKKNVEKLAKHFKGLDTLIFARIDASVNEHPKLEVEDYPTILFYPATDKSNPIKLSTKSSLKELAVVINKNLKNQQKNDEL